jgi:predicted ATPase
MTENRITELGSTGREGGFVGREREQSELKRALADARAGAGRFYLVAGEAGMGKTRLVDRLAVEARDSGFRVAWGRCWENADARPFWPWVQILRALLRDGGEVAKETFSSPAVRPLTQLIPELAGNEDSSDRPSTKSGTRVQLFDALTVALQQLVQTQPLLLIFDDLHAADEASLLLVRFFASEVRNSAILALGTYRRDAVADSSLCADVIAQLPRAGGKIELSGLSESEVATLFEAIAGHPSPPQITAAVHRATEGNPLFAHEVIGQFVSKGNIHRPDYSMGFRVPEGAREVIEQRMRLHLCKE